MEAYLVEWTNLLLRWLHVVAAIAWIGESFYFVMLDLSLKPPHDPEAGRRGVSGELWAIHGGGFYNSQKYLVSPPHMPDELHWSKWKAYATWLSGFALFTVLYLAQPQTYLIDPSVLDLSPFTADLFAVGFLILGWSIYDALCHAFGDNDGALSIALAIFVVLLSFAATHMFSGRAAFLIVGATMATIMAGNVFYTIIPGQRLMVDALSRGETPDPLPGIQGKQRSVHNTYFTLPVVFTMISNHYAVTYTAPHSWVVLSLIMMSGVLIRQFFVLRHTGREVWMLPAASAVLVAAAMVWIAPHPAGAEAQTAEPKAITLADIQPILAQRCAVCHSAHPTLMPSAPEGVMFDTPQEITTNAPRILQQAVKLKAMPLGNITGMTDAERTKLAQWIDGGAVQ
jgi:uncharacterized membrane protein